MMHSLQLKGRVIWISRYQGFVESPASLEDQDQKVKFDINSGNSLRVIYSCYFALD